MARAEASRRISRFLAAASLAALAACATSGPQDALAPAAVPTDWTAVSSALSDTAPVTPDWLGELTDPTVTDLVGEAIAYNNQLAAAGARVRAARERARIVRAGLLPQVTASLNGVRSRSSGLGGFVGGVPQPGGVYANSFSSGLNLSWELDVWGRLTDQTRSAYLQADAQALDYAAAALSIAGGAAQSYYALTEARLQTQLAERDVETGEANLRIIERRFERGISSSLDVRLARASLSQSRAQLIAREQAEQEAARRLEVLLGRYPGADIAADTALPEIGAMETADGTAIGTGSPYALLARRPDVLAAERRLKAQGFQVSAARKAMLPSLQLTAFAAENEATGPLFDGNGNVVGIDKADFMEAFDFDNVFARLVGGISAPIFQGGRIKAQIEAQRSQLEASVYDYANTVLTAYREVEDALAAEAFLTAQLDARRLAFEEAEAAEALTERQYLSGTTNIFNLINAQQRRIGSEGQFIAASRARLTNRIDLYLALGAPFAVDAAPARPDDRFTPPSRDPRPDAITREEAPRRGLFGRRS